MLYTAYDARKQRRFAHPEGIVGRTGLALLQKRGSAIETYLDGDLGGPDRRDAANLVKPNVLELAARAAY
jgi:hypothetical protein